MIPTTLTGIDKGQRMNDWYLDLCPELLALLSGCCARNSHRPAEEYIHRHWRPLYEQWLDNGRRLRTMYLFPVQHWEGLAPEAQVPVDKDTMARWICEPFHRAGVHGPHVHAHALRKAVATDLLRAQNDVGLRVATTDASMQPFRSRVFCTIDPRT